MKNALARAGELLEERSVPASEVRRYLEPAESLLLQTPFWEHQESSLALFLGPDFFRQAVLKVTAGRWVGVSDHFAVLPLLAERDRSSVAFVLVLSEKTVRLYHAAHGRLTPIEVPGLPENLEEALQLDPEPSLQGHTVARGAAGSGPIEGVHGHGAGKDAKREYRTEYFQRVNEAVSRHLRLETAPLVLATVRANAALYRKINTYPNLVGEALEGNIDHADTHELAAAVTERLMKRQRSEAIGELRELREAEGAGLVTGKPEELVQAAHRGSLRRLFLPWPAPRVTGSWDSETFEVTIDKSPDPLHADLLDLTAAQSWRKGTALRLVPADRWRRDAPGLGEFRWRDQYVSASS